MSSSTAPSRRFRSKTLTAALAFLFGSLGAHRFYLYGFRDVYGWAHLLATIIGIPGFMLLAATQRSAGLGWWLAVPGAISLLAAFLAALVYGAPRRKVGRAIQCRYGQAQPLRLDGDLRRDLLASDRRVPADDRTRPVVPDVLRVASRSRQADFAITPRAFSSEQIQLRIVARLRAARRRQLRAPRAGATARNRDMSRMPFPRSFSPSRLTAWRKR
jgi:TM2 domain-containing membrane protein YozV